MKHLNSFEEYLIENLQIIKSESNEKSYGSHFIKGNHQHHNIIVNDEVVGNIEWGKVDSETIEAISIYVDKRFRGNNYGLEALDILIKETGTKRVILKSAPSSKRYWRHLGYKIIKGTSDYFEKHF